MSLRKSWKLIWVGACVVLFLIVFFSFQGVRNPSWRGLTMGTSYSITIADRPRPAELADIKASIEKRLAEVDAQMSTWNPDSEISKFNDFKRLPALRELEGENFSVSPEFAAVVRRALKIAAATDGAFDPTVKPLVDHWGFGAQADAEPVAELMKAVGWQKVRVENNALLKANPDVQLDLSAIAKGYGVDAVAEVIRSSGFTNFLVEIGGEVVTSGTKENDEPWRIGIENPQPDGEIFQALELSGGGMATSGDYRNFRLREDGTRYSHIIDPATGMPAESDVASVSVMASACMDADAVATALFVMGSEKGFQWVETHPEFEALFILHSNQTFTTRATSGFPIEELTTNSH
ncbi:MAG: FAD:protein FMN transferase [Kiritimatiellaeota bacterium]|nr:FAD:protein FMN transferase [Kiritimatiellota bacterium]